MVAYEIVIHSSTIFKKYFVKETIVNSFAQERQVMYSDCKIEVSKCGRKGINIIKTLAPNFFNDSAIEGIGI